MKIIAQHVPYAHVFAHTTKRRALLKFALVLAVFGGYFLFLSLKFGAQQGAWVAALTWSFFVLCTPIADAGFLLDFPLRLLLHVRMFVVELLVWILAISINILSLIFAPDVYSATTLLRLFHHILVQPIPFWAIIALSAVGTFLSIRFGDELIDAVHHHERTMYHRHKHHHRFLIMIFLFAIALVLYHFLLQELGVAIV